MKFVYNLNIKIRGKLMTKFSWMVFFAVILVLTSTLCMGESISVDLSIDSEKVFIEPLEGYQRIRYTDPDAYSAARIGDPDLPAVMVRVLVPRDCVISGIRADETGRMPLGKYTPYPFQGYEILSKAGRDFIPPNADVYESGLIYPEKRITAESTGIARGFKILYFSYIPFEYDTGTSELYIYRHVRFTVSLSKLRHEGIAYRPNAVFNTIVSNAVINPSALESFYPDKMNPSAKATDYDMLIITTDNLLPASQEYADFRASAGISSVVRTVGNIISNYEGATDQLKIKNSIFQHVQNHNISYVLFIGDGGTSVSYSVPDQNLYGYLGADSDNTIPGDVFYSSFDGAFNWNADGDSRVGEMNGDNADISPDVIIGRLSVRQPQQVLDYKNKVASYISSLSHPTFPENLLLSGVQLFNYTGDAEAKSERLYNNYIAPYWETHNKHTLYDTTATVNISNLKALLEQGMNFFHMATHGGVTVWSMETGLAFSSANALALNNIPGIIITIACTSNAFDPEVSGAYDPCLGEAFTRNPNGGSIIYIGASRYGLGEGSLSGHGPSFQYNDWIFRYTLENTYQNIIGAGFTQSKIHMTGAANSDYGMRWVHLALNLLGDPSIKAHKQSGGGGVPVYRFFNTQKGGHLYTISEVERYNVEQLPQWSYEGIAFSVYNSSGSGGTPAFRFFNTRTGIHLYTINPAERDSIMDLPQWSYEGISFYVLPGQETGTVPVYRFFNNVRGGHFYTINEAERDSVMQLPQWSYEGVVFYVFAPA